MPGLGHQSEDNWTSSISSAAPWGSLSFASQTTGAATTAAAVDAAGGGIVSLGPAFPPAFPPAFQTSSGANNVQMDAVRYQGRRLVYWDTTTHQARVRVSSAIRQSTSPYLH